jgi:hypothetical protein
MPCCGQVLATETLLTRFGSCLPSVASSGYSPLTTAIFQLLPIMMALGSRPSRATNRIQASSHRDRGG